MTGLESIQDQPNVLRYLQDHGLRAQALMPSWPGWDKPHLMNVGTGAIVPTSIDMLLTDVERYERTGNAFRVSLTPEALVEALVTRK